MGREKQADEIFCRYCGEAIKRKAEICPECGVRNPHNDGNGRSSGGSRSARNRPSQSPSNQSATQSTSSSTPHDPDEYETTVSDRWWYGVAIFTALWVGLFALVSVIGDTSSPLPGLLVLVTWFGLPLSAYFDTKYVRANSKWNPTTALWVVVLAIWFVNIAAGALYLFRRHEALGEP